MYIYVYSIYITMVNGLINYLTYVTGEPHLAIFLAQDIHKLLGLLTCLTSEFTLPLVLNVIMTHICFILCMAQSFPSKLHDPI